MRRRRSSAARRRCALLLAFRAADPGTARGAVRDRVRRRATRRRDPGLHRPHRLAGHRRSSPRRSGRTPDGSSLADGGAVAGAAAGRAFRAARSSPTSADPRAHQPGALAEPLARRAAELDVFPERFRRPHRQPRHADRPGAARERRLWRSTRSGTSSSTAPARSRCWRRPIGGWRCRSSLWFAGYGGVLRCFLPRMRERSRRMSEMRSDADRPGRRQLHQHPDRQAVRPARDEDAFVREAVDEHTDAYRAQLRMTIALGLSLQLMNAAMVVGTGGARDLAVGAAAHTGRHRRDGDADGLADRQHRRLGGAEDRQHLREYRRGAGRHALDRGAAPDAGPARMRSRCRGRAARCASRRCSFGYGRTAARRRAARPRSRRRAGRAGRAGRPLGRRQIDPRQSAARLLPAREGPHPDRRAATSPG